MQNLIYTLLIGSIGATIFTKLKVPAGAMIGSMVFVAIFNILTSKGYMPSDLKIVGQVIVGSIVGLNFNKEAILGLKKLVKPASLLVVGLTSTSLILGFSIYKITGLDLITALFSCAPGGLTDMTIMSESFGAKIHIVAILHLIRLITVLTIFPIVIKFIINRENRISKEKLIDIEK